MKSARLLCALGAPGLCLLALASSAAAALAQTGTTAPGALPRPAFANVRDYGYMWWQDGLSTPVYFIKTSRYAISFDTANFNQRRYVGVPVALTGSMPWAMTLDSPTEARYAPANRGFVIRSWRARLNGSDHVPPYLAERSAAGASLFDLVPPPGVSTLKAGDSVEAELVRFYVPKHATDYVGPNAHFRRALTDHPNSYRIGLREAVGNNLKVTLQGGTLERLFPIQILATNNRAAFTVTGGIGCVPVTFTGLTDYRAPLLEAEIDGAWTPVDQAVHGSDFWQCDYDAERGAWDITFTLRLDGTDYQNISALMTSPRSHRFRVGAPQAVGQSALMPSGAVEPTDPARRMRHERTLESRPPARFSNHS